MWFGNFATRMSTRRRRSAFDYGDSPVNKHTPRRKRRVQTIDRIPSITTVSPGARMNEEGRIAATTDGYMTTPADGTPGSDVENVLLAPYRHICETKRANIRAKVAEAFNYWLQIPDDVMTIIGDTTELVHNGSLLLDDIKDNSSLRRGVPAAHIVYGVPQTITCANYTLVLVLQKLQQLNCPDAVCVLTEQLQQLLQGDSMEIDWIYTGHCPTQEQYSTMSIGKRGGMFQLVVRVMQLFSTSKSDFKPLVDNFGLYYQIRNDYINLCSTEYMKNNGYCTDLTEGKFSFPIIHAIQSDKQDRRVLSILRQRTTDVDVKQYCVSLLEEKGSFAYTRKALFELEQRMREQIGAYGGNPRLVQIIDAMTESV